MRRSSAAAHGRRGGDWAALSRRNPNISASSADLPPPKSEEFSPLPTSSHRHDPPLPSFASVLSRTLPDLRPSHHDAPPPSHRLLQLHPWADETLISDILHAFNLDEELASSYLSNISDDSRHTTSASDCPSSSQTDNDEPVSGAAETQRLLPSSIAFAPVEPEWFEDDIYHSSRKEALRMSRASGKHSRGAHRAFLNGDHSRATMLSKKASKERLVAERMHQEAAERIFRARNGDSPEDLWRLDMHGLHVGEAVTALQTRLLHIEALFCRSRQDSGCAADGNICDRRPTKEVSCSDNDIFSSQKSTHRVKTMLDIYLPFGRGLEVITGVGNHSRDGSSLPTAIRNFLTQNRYKFEDSRPGMLMVYPKFQFLKDK